MWFDGGPNVVRVWSWAFDLIQLLIEMDGLCSDVFLEHYPEEPMSPLQFWARLFVLENSRLLTPPFGLRRPDWKMAAHCNLFNTWWRKARFSKASSTLGRIKDRNDWEHTLRIFQNEFNITLRWHGLANTSTRCETSGIPLQNPSGNLFVPIL